MQSRRVLECPLGARQSVEMGRSTRLGFGGILAVDGVALKEVVNAWVTHTIAIILLERRMQGRNLHHFGLIYLITVSVEPSFRSSFLVPRGVRYQFLQSSWSWCQDRLTCSQTRIRCFRGCGLVSKNGSKSIAGHVPRTAKTN